MSREYLEDCSFGRAPTFQSLATPTPRRSRGDLITGWPVRRTAVCNGPHMPEVDHVKIRLNGTTVAVRQRDGVDCQERYFAVPCPKGRCEWPGSQSVIDGPT